MLIFCEVELKVELPDGIFMDQVPVRIRKGEPDLNKFQLVAIGSDQAVLGVVGMGLVVLGGAAGWADYAAGEFGVHRDVFRLRQGFHELAELLVKVRGPDLADCPGD